LDDQPATAWMEGRDGIVLLPRAAQPPSNTTATLALHLADGRTFRQLVPLTIAPSRHPPTLLSCAVCEGGIQTFESRLIDPQQYQGRAGFAVQYDDPQQGTCVRFQNDGAAAARLDGRMLPLYDPLLTPLLQFRYRADPMAHVSLTAGRCNLTFSESFGALAAPGATGILDHAWHTWMGMPVLAMGTNPLNTGFAIAPSDLRVGSRASLDQTGRYSTMTLDDIACGPAVGPNRPLAFRPVFGDRAGVAEVCYALAAGAQPWTERTAAERKQVHWTSMANEQQFLPDTSALPEGVHHLLVRARNARDVWSEVYDVPFLVDCHPPQITCALRSTPELYNGVGLQVVIRGDYAPPVTRAMRLTLDGKPLDLTKDNGTLSGNATCMQFEIDLPWLLRRQLRSSTNGDTFNLSLEGVSDSASNLAQTAQIPIQVVYSNDATPPTVLLPLKFPTNLLVCAPQFRQGQDFFNSRSQATVLDPQQDKDSRFLAYRLSGQENTTLSRVFSNPWDPEAFPWLAISLRLDGEIPTSGVPVEVWLRPAAVPAEAAKPANGNAYTLGLGASNSASFVLGKVNWKAGQWNDLLVNARAFLREQSKMPKGLPLRELLLCFPGKAKFTVHVRAAAVLAPWGADSLLKFRAYDFSGVAGLVWQGRGTSPSCGLRPARIQLPADDPLWLRVRVADRAGNQTSAFLFPVPPGGLAVPESLPAEVEVEDF
jgi:hypothetical protein